MLVSLTSVEKTFHYPYTGSEKKMCLDHLHVSWCHYHWNSLTVKVTGIVPSIAKRAGPVAKIRESRNQPNISPPQTEVTR